MRGRKPKPTALKLLEGNPGGRPINHDEPKPTRSRPTCPSHLSPTAKAEWKRIAEEMENVGLLTRIDRVALAVYCQAYGKWVEAERKLAETPPLLKMPSGYIQVSPWVTISNKQAELMAKYMAELGLTPSARSRLSVSGAHTLQRDDPAWEFLGD
ncbi:phage terminase small subunit P27 family [Pseudooceanicola sp.]|uniref:phage terminase small subunit P27 family n=1 Tax=Pseudooceanicola sp. TaxID=1914328 RepID=UPI0035C781EC